VGRASSLRAKIAMWSALIFTAGMIGLLGVIWVAARSAIDGVFDAMLRDRLQQRSAQLRASPPDALQGIATLMAAPTEGAPAGMVVEIRVDGQRLLATGPGGTPMEEVILWPEVSPGGAPSSDTVMLAGGALYHGVGLRVRDTSPTLDVFVAAPLGPVAEVLRRQRQQLLWIVPVVLALSALGGYWVSGRALAPVRRVIEAARSTSVRHLSERVPEPDTRDTIEELARTFNDMLDRIEQPVRRQEAFVADASHELRTPLAAIQNTAELALERPRTAGEYREALGDVLRESRNLSRMVEQLLVLARADAGESLPFTAVDLGKLCAEAAEDYSLALADGGRRFLVVPAAEPLVVHGHADSLRRVIAILLDNAVKYTLAGGEITLRTGAEQSRPFVEVSDTGIGIAPEDLASIFDRFYRVDRARSRAKHSFGLGLAIAKAIAQSHRAEILVSSRIDHGTTFRVWFPTADEDRSASAV
jgi:heavy metal sensor kinase